MIIEKSSGRVISSGVRQSTGFKIAANGKAFAILTGNIYSNPKLAIVRELSTNAADAHTDAGTPDRPIEIDAPGFLDPTLVIRDFGTGMSEEKLTTVFTTFFASDKTTRNDVTGCLGLGSKTPFAYTDVFTVVSRFHGTKIICTMYKDDDGAPVLNVDDRQSTSEPNGIEIRVPINKSDVTEFCNLIRRVVRWFRVKPIVRGLDVEYPTPVASGTGWRLYDRKDVDETIVVMGNIGYPITMSTIRYNAEVEGSLLGGGLVLDVPIGHADIQASRESLMESNKTSTNLVQTLKSVETELRKHLSDQISSATNMWEARKMLYRLTEHPCFKSLIDGEKIAWRDRVVTSMLVTAEGLREGDVALPCSVMSIYLDERTRRQRARSNSSDFGLRRTQEVMNIPARPDVEFWINDLPAGTYARLERYLQPWARLREKKAVYVLTPRFEKQEQFKAWLESEGLSDIVKYSSSLPKPVIHRQPRDKTERRTAQVLRAVPGHTFWSGTEVDLEAGGFYVPVVNQRWVAGRFNGDSGSTFDAWIKSVSPIFDDVTPKVVGVRGQQLPKFEKNKKWIRIDRAVDAMLSLISPKDIAESGVWGYLSNQRQVRENLDKLEWLIDDLGHQSPALRKVQKQLNHYRELSRSKKLEVARTLVGEEAKSHWNKAKDAATVFESLCQEVMDHYKLIYSIDQYSMRYHGTNTEHVFQYLKARDRAGFKLKPKSVSQPDADGEPVDASADLELAETAA